MIELILTSGCAGTGTAAVLAAESLGIDTGGATAIGRKGDGWISENVSRADCVLWVGGREMAWHAVTAEKAGRKSRPMAYLDDHPANRVGNAAVAAILAKFKCVYVTGEFNVDVHAVCRRLRSILMAERRLSKGVVPGSEV